MSKIDELIDGLEDKIKGIVSENYRLINENREIQQKQITLLQRIADQNNQVKQLEDHLESLRQGVPGKEHGNIAWMKSEIDRLVREIDICIDLLNQ